MTKIFWIGSHPPPPQPTSQPLPPSPRFAVRVGQRFACLFNNGPVASVPCFAIFPSTSHGWFAAASTNPKASPVGSSEDGSEETVPSRFAGQQVPGASQQAQPVKRRPSGPRVLTHQRVWRVKRRPKWAPGPHPAESGESEETPQAGPAGTAK